MTASKGAKTSAGTPERTAYLVVGMHRSGTSAVTQMLALAGASLPENVMASDEHNARGYFEPWKVAVLNDERLRAAGSAWDDIFAFPHRPLPTRLERGWLTRAEALFDEEFGDIAFPLLKDPRLAVLMPFWRTVLTDLDVGARCVIPVRHPLAVAGSLARRDGFSPEKSVLLWSAYMLAAESYTRGLPRAFVSYDGLLADWRAEVARIETAHGAPLPKLTKTAARAIDRFLTPQLRHNDGHEGLDDLGWAGALASEVFDWFAAAATDAAPAPDGLARAAGELARRQDDLGPLITPLTRDLDAHRHEVVELRHQLEFERANVQRLEAEIAAQRRAFEQGPMRSMAELIQDLQKDSALAAQRLNDLLADS